MALDQYREIVPLKDIPDNHLRLVLEALLEHLGVEIVREQTPEYTNYEMQLAGPKMRRTISIGEDHSAAIGETKGT